MKTTLAAIRVGSVELKNPVLTASGTSGHGADSATTCLWLIWGSSRQVTCGIQWPGNPAPRLHRFHLAC